MKITDLKCAIIGSNPVVRITTDEGIDGYGQAEHAKRYLKPHVLFYRDMLLGKDPTDVERVMTAIRRLGAFKPWGSAVSAIEFALWDIAGKAAGVPVYKLLGGKVRDEVRVYNGAVRFELAGHQPEDYAENMRRMQSSPEGFSIIKQAVAFHGSMAASVPDFHYGQVQTNHRQPHRGALTPKGFNHLIACIEAMTEVCGDKVGLALDVGPGMTPVDLLRLAKECERFNLMWIEDALTGDYVPCDIGGIAELKWVAEYADLHGILMAPHGTGDGLIGLAALVHMSAALPPNYIAFEYPTGNPEWWYDIVDGLPDPIVADSFIEVWDAPGLGVTFNEKAREYLKEEDRDFFD